MRVPANPWTKVTSVSGNSAKSEDEQSDQNPFIVPMQSRKPPQDPILTARLKEAIVAEKENQTPAAPNPMSDPWTADGLPNMGFHKSRERARRPAVLRLVERKQAQKEKERERDRKARAKSSETIRSSTNNIKFGAGLSSTSTSAFSCNADQGLDTACVNDKLGEKHRRFSSNDVPSHSELMQNGLGSRRCASSSRLASQERTEILTKTYIRIGPGKPAQIREHSPSKSPSPPFARKPSLAEEDESDLSSFEARLQREKSSSSSPPYSRSSSPAKSSGLLFKFDARPLKSTGLLKDISTPEGETSSSSGSSAKPQERKRKRSYITEKTINIGLAPERPRRSASEHNLNSHRKSSSSSSPTNSTIHESKSFSVESSPRCSTDREFHPNSPSSSTSSSSKATTASFSSSFSTTSSKFGGSSDSVSSDSSADSHLSQRRKSLERRFQSRSSRLSSTPERKPAPGEVPPSSSPASSASSGFSSASSRLLYNLSSGYRYHRAAVSASASNKPRRFSQDHTSQKSSCKPSSRLSSRSTNGTTEQPAPSRKISLPPTCYEDPDRSVASAKRLADQKKDQGNEQYKTKNYREALQLYSEAITLDPQCPAYYSNRSACHMMLAQFNEGLNDAKTSVELDSEFTKGYIRMVKCCIALGEVASAKQALQKALAIEPNNVALITEKNSLDTLERFKEDALLAHHNKDYRKALFCLDRALTIGTACRNLKILRAECLAFLGRTPESQEVATDLLRLDGMNVDAMYVRGLCLYYEDNVDKAFSHFQKVLMFAPDHTKARHIYKKAKTLKQKKEEGNTAFKSAKLDDAYKLYSEALEIDPCNKMTNAKLYFNRGTVAARMQKYKQSVEDCSAALKLDEGYQKALLRRAKSYMGIENFEEAVRDYEKALMLDRSMETKKLLQHAKLELKKSKRKDYYKILGVSKTASEDEIKKAYRKRALVHHPDRHSSATEDEKKEHEKKFKEVGEAYGVLSDSQKRTRYDNGHDLENLEGGHGFSGHNVDPNDIFRAFFNSGGMAGGGGGMPNANHFSFGGGNPPPGAGGFSFQFG
eukprot:maker-scaffold101_size371023-snap-gene-0.23 protein:Tk03055 transcript:maker-scaffold101_size371023-snap-gene-0.23-mRNA-1 annotation:"-like protein subfamily c member 7"